MSYEAALVIVGVPIIIGLAVRAVRRMAAIRQRIHDVQSDLAQSPQNPYLALAELYAPPSSAPEERSHVQRND